MNQNQIDEIEQKEFFEKVIPLRFSCLSSSGWPVILSLWYIYKDRKIYCATQKNAKVIQYLKNNPKCAFEIAADSPPYKGVRGQGTVTLRDDLGNEILLELIDKYLGNRNTSLAKFLLDQSDNEVCIEINPAKLFKWDYSQRMGS